MPNLKEIKKIYAESNLIYPSLPEVNFWMENLTTVIAAYSFIKLKTGNIECCRIRESLNNNDIVIGFNTLNVFDETSAINFTGNNNGFIVSMTDQHEGTYPASQVSSLNQPAIVEGGKVIKTEGSRPHLRNDFINDCLFVDLPNNQVYYCIASTWSGITHGNFYTASSGATELPFGVDFFDLLILSNDSEKNTIIPEISNRILDGPYDNYFVRFLANLTTTYVFNSIIESEDPGAKWEGTGLEYVRYGQARQNDSLKLRLKKPENITTFSVSSKNLKGVFPPNLDLLTNLNSLNCGSSSNKFSGFFPQNLNLSSNSLSELRAEFSQNLIGDTPNINGSTVSNNFYIYSCTRLNGALILPENCPNLRNYYAYNCSLSRFVGQFQNCPSLERFYFYLNNIFTNLPDFSNSFPSLVHIYGYQNTMTGTISTLINSPSLRQFRMYDNQITGVAFNFSVPVLLTDFRLENNLLSAAAVNQILVAFDVAAANAGILNLGGTGNAPPDAISGGFDGLAAKTNLQAKSWAVTTN